MHSSVIISKESLNSQLISLSANIRDLWPRIFSHNYIFDTSGAGRKVVLVGIFVSRHKPTTVLRFTLVSWRILRVSFEACVSNEQPLAEKTRMSSSLLNT